MNPRVKRTCAALIAWGVLGLATVGCHNTWQGVKEDTHKAVHKTEHGLDKAGEKVERSDKKKSEPPSATKGDAGSS